MRPGRVHLGRCMKPSVSVCMKPHQRVFLLVRKPESSDVLAVRLQATAQLVSATLNVRGLSLPDQTCIVSASPS
jgi:hypothetical protein